MKYKLFVAAAALAVLSACVVNPQPAPSNGADTSEVQIVPKGTTPISGPTGVSTGKIV